MDLRRDPCPTCKRDPLMDLVGRQIEFFRQWPAPPEDPAKEPRDLSIYVTLPRQRDLDFRFTVPAGNGSWPERASAAARACAESHRGEIMDAVARSEELERTIERLTPEWAAWLKARTDGLLDDHTAKVVGKDLATSYKSSPPSTTAALSHADSVAS